MRIARDTSEGVLQTMLAFVTYATLAIFHTDDLSVRLTDLWHNIRPRRVERTLQLLSVLALTEQ
jgi:hypothetical protein